MICKGFMLLIPAVDPGMDAEGNIQSGGSVMLLIILLNAVAYALPHVLMAYSLYKIALRRGIPHAWLAWVPLVNYGIVGALADGYRAAVSNKATSKRKWLFGLGGGMAALMGIMYLAELTNFPIVTAAGLLILLAAMLALNLVNFLALHDLYASCDPARSVLYLILSVMFWFLQPVLVFSCRYKDRGLP